MWGVGRRKSEGVINFKVKLHIQESSSAPSEIHGTTKSCNSKADRVNLNACWQQKQTHMLDDIGDALYFALDERNRDDICLDGVASAAAAAAALLSTMY